MSFWMHRKAPPLGEPQGELPFNAWIEACYTAAALGGPCGLQGTKWAPFCSCADCERQKRGYYERGYYEYNYSSGYYEQQASREKLR